MADSAAPAAVIAAGTPVGPIDAELQTDAIDAAAPVGAIDADAPVGAIDAVAPAIARPTGRFWNSRNITVLGIVLIAAINLAVLPGLWAARGAALREARVTLSTKGIAIAEQTARAVQAADLVLRTLQDKVTALARDGDLANNATLLSAGFQAGLKDSIRNLPQIDGIGVIGANGNPLMFSRDWPVPPLDLADRDFFDHAREYDDSAPFIGNSVIARSSGTRTFSITRRVNGPNGTFAGVVTCTLALPYFEEFYKTLNERDGMISLIRRDGILLARDPVTVEGVAGVGFGFPPNPAWRVTVDAGGGFYDTTGVNLFPPQLVSVHPLPLYPLVVDVARSREATLANWRHDAMIAALLTLAGSAGLFLLFRALAAQVRAMDRQHADMKAAAEALSRSQRRLRDNARDLETTLAAMDAGVIMVNPAQRVVVSNPRVSELLGLPPGFLARRPLFEDLLKYQWKTNEFSRTDVSLIDFIKTGGLAGSPPVYERARPNGRFLEIRTAELTGGGAVRFFVDITERRNAAALRAERDAAERASRAKSEFLATMSHEIRSPMSGLIGVLELLRATGLTDEQERMAAMVHNSATMLLAVLNDILDFSKIEAGALTVAPEPVAPRALLDDVVQPHAVAAGRKGLAVTLSIDPDLPQRISTDPLRLRQIVGNLLSNAIKFTAAGEVSVRVDCLAGDDATGKMLRCAVRDTGIGMTEAVMARLFNPFTQADGSTTRDFGGTGLGLSISRRLARLLGGDIVVASTPGEGSTFTLTLPLIACAAAADAADVADAGADTRVATAPPGCRLLVVDDDPTIQWLSRRRLETLGYAVATADDGEAALRMVRAERFDLVLTDCHMPRMDGTALTRAIRAAPEPAINALPVIGLTADVTDGQRERCEAAGMSDMAIKPLTVERLSRLLARHLPASGAAMSAVAPEAAAAPAPRSVAFDSSIYLEIFEPGDAAGAAWLREAMDTARRDVGSVIALADAAARGTAAAEPVRGLAHRLAGSAFSAGASLLGEAARALEVAAAAGDLERFAGLAAALEAASRDADDAIAAFLNAAPMEAPTGAPVMA